MYVPLEPFADLIKLAGSLVERAPDEVFTNVSCLKEHFACYPNFFQMKVSHQPLLRGRLQKDFHLQWFLRFLLLHPEKIY